MRQRCSKCGSYSLVTRTCHTTLECPIWISYVPHTHIFCKRCWVMEFILHHGARSLVYESRARLENSIVVTRYVGALATS